MELKPGTRVDSLEGLLDQGYDAVFIPDGYEVVFSALEAGVKNGISHRGRAMQALIPALRRLLDS